MKNLGSLILFIFTFSISLIGQSPVSWESIALEDLQGNKITLASITGNKANVFFFLSADCPLCENYSVTINKLRKKYSDPGVRFIGLFSGKYVVKKDVERYLAEFNPSVTVLLDGDYKMMRLLKAQVTPEVFAFDADNQLFYQGKIDNWIASLGKYRTNITRNYLEDALEARLNNKEVKISKTEAVGCFIE